MLSKELVSQSQSEKSQFHIFLGQNSFFVIFLCYRVKPLLAFPVAMVPIIRDFKNYYFFVLQMYIMLNMFKIIQILSCWKEIVCFENAIFVKYAIFVKSLMVRCFSCHGSMN